MAITISTQDLENVRRDIKDIGKAVNEKVIVSPRYGDDFKSLPMIAEEFQISSDAAEAAAVTAVSAAQSASSSANIAEAAATAATIGAGVFETPEAGVDPVTGVADGAYYNVRSSSDDSYVDEYQNIGGVPTPSGKSYPSSAVVQIVAKHTALPFVDGKAYGLNERVQLENGDIVQSLVPNNTNDPNVDMTGWVVANPYFVGSPLEFLSLPSNRLKEGRWTSQDGYSWDVSSNGVGDFALHGKQVTVLPLGGCLHFEAFGSVGNADVDVTDKFINFAAASSARKLPWIVGAGEHFINPSAPINFTTSGVTHGVIVMDRSNPNATVAFVRDDDGEAVDVTAWNLTAGIRNIGATNAANKVVHIDSSEILIERLNNAPYVKREMVLLDASGSTSRPLTNTYNDKSKVYATAWEQSDPIYVKINVKLIGVGTGASSGSVLVQRDNCVVEEEYIRTGDANLSLFSVVSQCINTVFIRPKVEGVKLDGSGYGIMFSSTLNSRVEFGNMPNCRHSIAGRHNIDGVVLGGFYKDFDDHWGVNWLIQDCTFDPGLGGNCIGMAGADLTIIRPTQLSGRSLTDVRADTPYLAGRVLIDTPTVYSKGELSHYQGLFSLTNLAVLPFTTMPALPDEIIIENPKLEVDVTGSNLRFIVFATDWAVEHKPIGKIKIRGTGNFRGDDVMGVLMNANSTRQRGRNTIIDIDGDFDFGNGTAAYIYGDASASTTTASSVKLRGVSGNLRFSSKGIQNLTVNSPSKIKSITNDGNITDFPSNVKFEFNNVEFVGGAIAANFRNMIFNSCAFTGLYTQFPIFMTGGSISSYVSLIGCVKTVEQPNMPENLMNNQVVGIGSSDHLSLTSAQIASISHTVNTTGKFAGLMVWDRTNNRMMRASGSSASDSWHVIDGSASVVPA